MTAAVPPLLLDMAAAFGALAATVTAAGVLARVPVVRWVWRKLVTEPLGAWFREEVAEATDDIRAEAASSAHLVRYHLGSNDTTMPWHERLSRLEERHGLPPVAQQCDEGGT